MKARRTTDMTQLQEIQTFKNRFRTLFSHIPAIMFSSTGRIQQMNDAAEIALGLKRGELVGNSFFMCGCRIIDENGGKISSRALPWIVAGNRKKVVSNFVTGLVLPDGRHQWQQSTSMPLLRKTGRKPRTVITIFTDITRYKHAQAQFMQYQKMEAIGALASGLAHDFNNILGSILSSAQLLLLDVKDSPFQDCEPLKDIEAAALRGSELAKQLLTFSRPSASDGQVKLQDCLTNLRKFFRRTLPKNISIELELGHQEVQVRISPTQMEQVLLNLCLNARDAMPDGGIIRIKMSIARCTKLDQLPVVGGRPGTYARIDLSDTGTGIPAEILPRIFEPFFTSKEKHGGTGLGLSLVYSIVTKNRGYIIADSIPGKGTTMTLFLPAHPLSAKRHVAPTPPAPGIGGHETLLIVDDEEIITKSTARLLQRYGYHTLSALNGLEALDIVAAQSGKIDLVLMDMEMPEMDGSTCLLKLGELYPDLKVISLSGHITKPKVWDIVNTKARAFIQKPYDLNHLLRTVRSILDNTPAQPRPTGVSDQTLPDQQGIY